MTTIAQIQKVVAAHYRITPHELTSDRRSRRISVPRQIGYLLATEFTPHSLPVIAEAFRRSDHTTIVHGLSATRRRMDRDDDFRATVDILRDAVSQANYRDFAVNV